MCITTAQLLRASKCLLLEDYTPAGELAPILLTHKLAKPSVTFKNIFTQLPVTS